MRDLDEVGCPHETSDRFFLMSDIECVLEASGVVVHTPEGVYPLVGGPSGEGLTRKPALFRSFSAPEWEPPSLRCPARALEGVGVVHLLQSQGLLSWDLAFYGGGATVWPSTGAQQWDDVQWDAAWKAPFVRFSTASLFEVVRAFKGLAHVDPEGGFHGEMAHWLLSEARAVASPTAVFDALGKTAWPPVIEAFFERVALKTVLFSSDDHKWGPCQKKVDPTPARPY
jgi:hypothetical protein